MPQTQVLARKWRPKNFAELTGQEHVVKALTNALSQNRLHHAYLLTGTRGVGKTTIARILAKSLNCETGITASPCGDCAACRQIDNGSYIDLIELDAASNTQVDNMRELLENALYAPASARYKIYIIDEVHMLSKSAFNAMLKTLEEPPSHVKFVLATTDPQKIPVTVLSRCLQFSLKQIPQAQIAAHLQQVLTQENIVTDTASLQLIARAAQGSMRDALSLLDQAIAFGEGRIVEAGVRNMLGIIDQSYLFDLLEALSRQDGAGLLALADEMEAQCLSYDTALQDLASILHRIALAQTVPQAVDEESPDRTRIQALANCFSPDDIQLFYQIALQGRSDLSLAPDEYAGFTMTLMRMLAFLPDDLAATRAQSQQTTSPIAKKHASPETGLPKTQSAGSQPDWPQLAQQLKLTGMAKMLAQHSEAQTVNANEVQLRVPEAHKHLLDKKYQDKIQAALNAHFGKPVALKISVGTITGLTPVALQQIEEERKQSEAIAAMESDPVVQELIDQFDAKLNVATIKPIQQ